MAKKKKSAPSKKAAKKKTAKKASAKKKSATKKRIVKKAAPKKRAAIGINFHTGFRAVCTLGDYQGPLRNTKKEALDVGMDEHGHNTGHGLKVEHL